MEAERRIRDAEARRERARVAKEQARREGQERSAFKIQEWWRYNRNRRHLEQRGIKEIMDHTEQPPDLQVPIDPQVQQMLDAVESDESRLAKVEAAYQKALQLRGAVHESGVGHELPVRVEEFLNQRLHPNLVVDHSQIDELAISSPLQATRMASEYPGGKYSRKYQRKYALGQDGEFLEFGYNSDDSSASAMSDSDVCSSDEGIDRMTL
eukprot:TRINITY_DN60546_c0_g1_i3.p1 TRINITY_DN60546_c0_g1~~TRINITY_DN60546_c0_g1_i3.p1  ORF type:complete len:210 (+),score=66.58 TRINITY_DN60546_c0_g1_i3:209-838(+)